MGFLEKILPDIAVPVVDAITKGGPRRQFKWNMRAAYKTNEMNLQNQEATLQKNLRIQAEQRLYDSPAAQMARYKAAGLNPHLIYGGSGGSAGGAFPVDAGSPGSANIQPPSASYGALGSSFLAAGQTIANTELARARQGEVEMNTALKEIQIDIAKTNPMLSPDVAAWVATSMMEAARLKSIESRHWLGGTHGHTEPMNISKKINMEIEAMAQRLGLNTLDLSIKNKIFESKEFENAVKEIQVAWLKDGDMSPEHIRQGLMLILSKMLGIAGQK